MTHLRPRRSLALKLTLAFLVVGLAGSLVVAVSVRLQTLGQVSRFVLDQYESTCAPELVEYYETHGSWEGIEQRDAIDHPLCSGWRDPHRPDVLLVTDSSGVIVAGPPDQLGQHAEIKGRSSLVLESNGEVIGYIRLQQPDSFNRWQPGSPEFDFLRKLNRGILLSALTAIGLAMLIGALLARTISQPIRKLKQATRAVADGALGYQVEVRAKDELGELAESFNHMSADLARSTELRRQMTADIAHELRTPLSVILGYTEALSEGKLAGNEETFDVMYDEALRLQRLIDDLRTLSLADAGELSLMVQNVAPAALVERVAAAHMPLAKEKGVEVRVEAAPDLPEIAVDPDRVAQVLNNLVANALRYTPQGGNITLSARLSDDNVIFEVSDTGSGIAEEDLPRIFMRFYRADPARYAESGESGLGLAIAKSLIEAHGGTIDVTSTPGAGTTFTIRLPIQPAG